MQRRRVGVLQCGRHRGAWLALWIVLFGQSRTAGDFSLGVAAGDPDSSSVRLWTRADQPGGVRLEISRSASFSAIERLVSTTAAVDADLTVRVDLADLAPATHYFYRFVREDDPSAISETGRFRTAPRAEQAAPARFVFSGDANFAAAPFGLFSSAAAEGADAFLWVGDTIYADVSAGGLGAVSTLSGYRAKYAQVRSDPHVREMLASSAVWASWDDHEVVNDYAGTDPALPREQRDAAYQAFFEYMPIRPDGSGAGAFRAYRRFRYGAHAEFFILDNRQFREASAEEDCAGNLDPTAFLFEPFTLDGVCAARLRAPRTMLGAEQFAWLTEGLAASSATWKFVLSSVPISALGIFPYDRWDGYDDERRRLFEWIDARQISGVVFLAADIHANFYNPDVLSYFRRFRPDYDLPNETRVTEIIVGPIGNETLEQSIRGIAAGLLRSVAPGVGAGLSGGVLEVMKNLYVERLYWYTGMEYVELNRLAYAILEINERGDVMVAFRGATAEAAATPPAQVDTLASFRIERPGVSAPCFLSFLLPAGLAIALAGGRSFGIRTAA